MGIGCSKHNSEDQSPNAAVNTPQDPTASVKSIRVLCAESTTAKHLDALALDYKSKTGVSVDFVTVPANDLMSHVEKDVWGKRSAEFDLVAIDRSRIGYAVTDGHVLDITDWAQSGVPWSLIPAPIKVYFCQYQAHIYGFPLSPDALALVYRKDLFSNGAEQTAYSGKFGRKLSPPTSWPELLDTARFFTRPSKGQFGAALFYKGGDDGSITSGFTPLLWSTGNDYRDDMKGTVYGFVNSPGSIDALKLYAVDLKACCPPGAENFGAEEALKAFSDGKAAMAMCWISDYAKLTDKAVNRYASDTGIITLPKGAAGLAASLRGDLLAVSVYSKKQDAAKGFVKWFANTAQQMRWAGMNELSANSQAIKATLKSTPSPALEVFGASAPYLKDFYNEPERPILLDVVQTDWHNVADGAMTPKVAMDDIAVKHTTILKHAGTLK